jgi:putative transposase
MLFFNGERDAEKLASLTNYWIKKSKEELQKALTGNWIDNHLYELQDSFEMYHFWAIGYGVWSTGNITDDMVQK